MRLMVRARRFPVALSLVVFSIASALAAQTAPWRPFGSATEGFQAEFPSDPEASKNSVPVGGVNYELRSYVVEQASTAFYIGVCDYGAKGAKADPDAMLSGAEEGSLQHMSAHIQSEKKVTLDAGQGVESHGVAFEAENDKMHFSVRMYMAAGALYQVMVSYPLNEEPPDTAHFLDSFQLLPHQPAEAAGSAPQSPDWKPYPYPADGFSAAFPSLPVAEKQSMTTGAGTFELRTYVAKDSSVTLIAAVCNYGETAAGKDPDVLLDDAQKGAVNNLKAHLIGEKRITLGSDRGIEFEADSDSAHVSARVYLAGATLYQLIVATPLKAEYPDTARFLDSFQLLPSQASH